MKKILIVSTVSRQFYLFEHGNIELLKSLGYEVHGAANFADANERLDELDIVRHSFNILRSPISLKNIKAYKQLKNIMKAGCFNVVHCHTPMGGVLARIAAKSIGVSSVIYTAHGFHFYDGAPVLNWILYYPVEKFLSRYTDILITINKEDYGRAKNKFKATKVEYIPGIGIDLEKYNNVKTDRGIKRSELGLSTDVFLVLSVGELNKNKNHEVVIKAIAKLNSPNVHYAICGNGNLDGFLRNLSKKLGIENQVHFLGFRNDIPEICNSADVFAFPSFREGLSVALMEAMASGLPVIASRIRGNTDLILDCFGGFLHDPEDYLGIAKSIEKLIENKSLKVKMSVRNKDEVKKYDKQVVQDKMRKLYEKI